MEGKGSGMQTATLHTRTLTEDALTEVTGGVGYSSIKCKKCEKVFTDMDQYKRHVEEAHSTRDKR